MKIILLLFLLLGVSSQGFSQEITLEEIAAFYNDINVDCYKTKIQDGMESFNKWLVDTFPMKTDFPPPFAPSDINLMEQRVLPIISINYYNMERFDIDISIYDHLIIDSTLSVSLAVLDDKGKVIGLTDVEHEPYSYLDFNGLKRNNLYYDAYYIPLKQLVKEVEKLKPDALLHINAFIGGFGYEKDSKIFIFKNRRNGFVELDKEIKNYMLSLLKIHPDDNLRMIRFSDRLPQITTKEYWNSNGVKELSFRISGHTPSDKIRICGSRGRF